MRVALFSFDYAPLDGGIARLCTELRRGLVARGIDVSVLTAPNGASAEEPGTRRIGGSRPVRDARALALLARLERSDLVLCGRWYPEGLLALLAGREVVILAHGAELLAPRSARFSKMQALLRRHVLERARLVVANSRYTGLLVESIAPRARVSTLPLGVDTRAFQPGDRELSRAKFGLTTRYVVSTVSRVLPFKGHETVITALAQLEPALRADFTYLIAGRGAHRDALAALARGLGVTQQVKFAGLVPEADLVDVYRASDLFCLLTCPGVRAVEGFGLALLEAQSCGVPVLGTRTGGIPDAVEDLRTGFLLEPADAAGVEAHLRALVTAPERYRELGRAGRERATQSCSWEAYAERLAALLHGLPSSTRVSSAENMVNSGLR